MDVHIPLKMVLIGIDPYPYLCQFLDVTFGATCLCRQIMVDPHLCNTSIIYVKKILYNAQIQNKITQQTNNIYIHIYIYYIHKRPYSIQTGNIVMIQYHIIELYRTTSHIYIYIYLQPKSSSMLQIYRSREIEQTEHASLLNTIELLTLNLTLIS